MINNIIKKLFIFYKKINRYEHRKWCLAFISKKNLKILKVFYPPKNQFWADPFIFTHKNKDYCFFERFFYDKNRGEIACGEIKNNNLVNIKTIFKKNITCLFHIFLNTEILFILFVRHTKKKN